MKIRTRMLGAPALLLGLTAASCAEAPPPPPPAIERASTVPAARPDLAALDEYIRHAVRDWDVPGLAIAVVKDDSILFANGYGVRRVGHPGPVDTRTMFGLMSPTKTFTAAALAMLVDEGRLSWDDRVVDHLPHFRLSDSLATRDTRIRDLLSHRTGYGENHRLWYGTGGDRNEVSGRTAELERVTAQPFEFHYNNLMYVVAGEVIEAVSGQSWDRFVRERIFLPLEMKASTTSHRGLAERENVASPHARRIFNRVGPVRPIPYFDLDNIGPAGSIHTNVEEMAAWLRLHLDEGTFRGRRLLRPPSIRELQRPHSRLPIESDARIGGDRAWAPLRGVVDFESRSYGLGWFVVDYRGHPVLMHGGGINGQRSAVGLMPGERVGVVVLSNMQDTEIALALTYRVFDMFLDVEPRDWSEEYRRVR